MNFRGFLEFLLKKSFIKFICFQIIVKSELQVWTKSGAKEGKVVIKQIERDIKTLVQKIVVEKCKQLRKFRTKGKKIRFRREREKKEESKQIVQSPTYEIRAENRVTRERTVRKMIDMNR